MRSLAPSAASSAMNYRSSQSYCKICRSARAPICFHILVKVSSWWALAILFTFCWFVVVAGRGALSFFLLLSSSIEYVVVYFPIFFFPVFFSFSLQPPSYLWYSLSRGTVVCVCRKRLSIDGGRRDGWNGIHNNTQKKREWMSDGERRTWWQSCGQYYPMIIIDRVYALEPRLSLRGIYKGKADRRRKTVANMKRLRLLSGSPRKTAGFRDTTTKVAMPEKEIDFTCCQKRL